MLWAGACVAGNSPNRTITPSSPGIQLLLIVIILCLSPVNFTSHFHVRWSCSRNEYLLEFDYRTPPEITSDWDCLGTVRRDNNRLTTSRRIETDDVSVYTGRRLEIRLPLGCSVRIVITTDCRLMDRNNRRRESFSTGDNIRQHLSARQIVSTGKSRVPKFREFSVNRTPLES